MKRFSSFVLVICCNRRWVWTEHPHTSHFLASACTRSSVAHDIGSTLSASRHPCFTRNVCSDLSATLHFALYTVSLIFILIFIFIFHVGWFGEQYTLRFREWGIRHFGRQESSHKTSSWCSFCFYPSRNGRCSKIIENSKVGMFKHLDSYTSKQMAYFMVQYGRPSHSSWAKSVRSFFSRTVMGKAIWENPVEVQLGESFQLGMFFRTQ